MFVNHKLTFRCKPLHGFPLPNSAVTLDIINDAGLQDKKPAVYSALARLRLFGELGHAIPVENHSTEPGGRPNCCDGR